MHICKKLCIFVSIQLKTSPHSLFAPFLAKIPLPLIQHGELADKMCTRRFETKNWYNDISTRDRSREGAEEAIDLSEGFKNPNYELGPAPPRARGLALWDVRGQDAASVRRCRSAKIGHQ